MKKLLLKVGKAFVPKRFKVWFPALGKVVVLGAGLFAISGNPEQAEHILKLVIEYIGEDSAFIALVGTTLAGVMKISQEIVSDVQVARGKPPITAPIVETVFGHDFYVEEFQKAYDETKDYKKAVKVATGKTQEFEEVFHEEYKRLTNNEGLPANDAFVRARNLAKTKTNGA